MNENLAKELLAFHADQLCDGIDLTANLSQQYPMLAPMFEIAQATFLQLQPITTSPAVRQAMYAQFGRTTTAPVPIPSRNWRTTGAAVGIGSAVTGVAILLARHYLFRPASTA